MPEATLTQTDTSKTLDFGALITRHRDYFRSGITRSAGWREKQLIALRSMMKEHAEDFYAALWTDLRRNRIEADWIDVKYMTSEIDHVLEHMRDWMKPLPVSSPLVLAPSHGQVRFDPLGVGLIIGTWNYPLMLTLSPLVAAISAGNAAVIKPSELGPSTADVMARLIPEYLDQSAFSVVLGGAQETTALLEQPWDHIFFTGGTTVAKIVMTAAAKNLTPVVLELGGKNPCIALSCIISRLRIAAEVCAEQAGRCFNRRLDAPKTGWDSRRRSVDGKSSGGKGASGVHDFFFQPPHAVRSRDNRQVQIAAPYHKGRAPFA
jgi:acyl-CoA reductase-like NAD-dependent aldehyde dehydrogenase